jgi:Rieske Fe-S protein
VALGGAALLPPVIGGIAVAIDPLRRGAGTDSEFVRVTTLEALPEDGLPRKFTVFADQVDAWNKLPEAPVGAIYLRRTGAGEVSALHSTCPHAGCFVEFVPAGNHFWCPCHNSEFTVDGSIQSPSSPASRPLDALAVEIRNQNEVWVKFQNFRTGTSRKIAV